jgi:hypothetical protein
MPHPFRALCEKGGIPRPPIVRDFPQTFSAGAAPQRYNTRKRRYPEASMPSPLIRPYPWVRIACLVILTLLVAAWGTCNTMIDFNSCQGMQPMAQLTSLLPGAIAGNSESVLLTANGSGFTSQSQILWDGSALPTVFVDSGHLETTITQQTFASFGGSSGSSVQISVKTLGSATGCPPGGNTATLELVIN